MEEIETLLRRVVEYREQVGGAIAATVTIAVKDYPLSVTARARLRRDLEKMFPGQLREAEPIRNREDLTAPLLASLFASRD